MRGPLLWMFALLAAMQTLTAGIGLTGVVAPHIAGLLSLITASFQSGLIAYLGLSSGKAASVIMNSPAGTSVSLPNTDKANS